MEDKIKEARNTSKLFGMLFLCCLVAAALGFYWYFTSTGVVGILICAILLLLLCVGSFWGRFYYNNKVKNLTDDMKKGKIKGQPKSP